AGLMSRVDRHGPVAVGCPSAENACLDGVRESIESGACFAGHTYGVDAAPRLALAEIDLVEHGHGARRVCERLYRPVGFMGIGHVQDQVGAFQCAARALDSLALDFVAAFAHARGVHEAQWNSAETDHFLDHVARCTCARADNGALIAEEAVEKR